MKNKKFAKSIAGILACTAMLTGVIPAASLSASAAEYKVYKNDVTVNFYGEQFTHDEFEVFWVAVYENFGADVTIECVKDYTGSPHSEEWIRTGGPVFFADCWFQLHWYAMNDMNDNAHRYFIGKGWRNPDGWR